MVRDVKEKIMNLFKTSANKNYSTQKRVSNVWKLIKTEKTISR